MIGVLNVVIVRSVANVRSNNYIILLYIGMALLEVAEASITNLIIGVAYIVATMLVIRYITKNV